MEPFNYMVYQLGQTYHAVRNSDGSEIATGPLAGPVIQAALDQPLLNDRSSGVGPGDVYIRSGQYTLLTDPNANPRFTGLNVHSNTRIIMDNTAFLQVPPAYAGPVFALRSSANNGVVHSEIVGGRIRAIGNVQGNYTGFLLEADDPTVATQAGIFFNRFENTIVNNPAVGIAVHVVGHGGFITSNTFSGLRIWAAKTGVDFSVFPGYQLGQQNAGILYNNFSDLHFEWSGNAALYTMGISNVSGVHNTFFEVKTWDIPNGKPAMTISNKALETLVIGGTLGGQQEISPGYIKDNGTAAANKTSIIF